MWNLKIGSKIVERKTARKFTVAEVYVNYHGEPCIKLSDPHCEFGVLLSEHFARLYRPADKRSKWLKVVK